MIGIFLFKIRILSFLVSFRSLVVFLLDQIVFVDFEKLDVFILEAGWDEGGSGGEGGGWEGCRCYVYSSNADGEEEVCDVHD